METFNHNFRKNNELLNTIPVYLLVLTFYFIISYYGGESLNIWGANIFYDNWVNGISELSFGFYQFFESYNLNLTQIASPEPVSGYLIYIITRFTNSPVIVFHIINSLFLFFLTFFVLKTYRNKLLFILLIFIITCGYYEFILVHMTHRFKIAVLFFLASVYYLDKNKKISEWLMALTVLTHFSMLSIIPLLYFFRRLGLNVTPKLSVKKLFLTLIVIISSHLLSFKYFTSINLGSTFSNYNELFVFMIGRKFKKLNFIYENDLFSNINILTIVFMLIAIIAFFLIYVGFKFLMKKKKSSLFVLFLVLTYIVSTLIIVGTSRLLQVYYIVPLIIFLSNYRYMSQKKRRSFLMFFSPFILWNLFRSFEYGPLPIIYNNIF